MQTSRARVRTAALAGILALAGSMVGSSARPVAAADPVLVGAGDIADCSLSGDTATAASTFTDSGTSPTHGAPPPRTRSTFVPRADAYVSQANPDTRYGTSTRLIMDGDIGSGLDAHTYVKATVIGPAGRSPGAIDPPRPGPPSRTWVGSRPTPGSTSTSRAWFVATGPTAS